MHLDIFLGVGDHLLEGMLFLSSSIYKVMEKKSYGFSLLQTVKHSNDNGCAFPDLWSSEWDVYHPSFIFRGEKDTLQNLVLKQYVLVSKVLQC